jgi:hypothetical protein
MTVHLVVHEAYEAPAGDALFSFLDNLARDCLATPPSLLRSVAA